MSRDPIDPNTGELQDFEARPGDPTYAQVAGSQRGSRRQRWGNRVLLAVQPSNNPNLGGAIARNRATVVEVGDLGIVRPLAVQVRFAQNVGGKPQLPFAPLTQPFASSDLIQLVWTIRRGIDPVADATRDTYWQPLSQPAGSIYGQIDRAPFDVIAARSLGIDVELQQTDATGLAPPTQPTITTNYWVEVIAFPITNEGNLQKLTAWQNLAGPSFRPASATSIVLIPLHNARCQFFICNTSTNANLWVSFGTPAILTPTPQATFVLPSSPQFSVYESPVDGFRGIVYGIWDNATPNGGALVTEGERMSGLYP